MWPARPLPEGGDDQGDQWPEDVDHLGMFSRLTGCACLQTLKKDLPLLEQIIICLPMDTLGYTSAKRIDKMGMKSSDTAAYFLDDVRVPAKEQQETLGGILSNAQFQEEFACVALAMTPKTAINQTIAYLKEEGICTTFDQQPVHPLQTCRITD